MVSACSAVGVAAAGRVAEGAQQRQRDAGGQRQVELGGEVPPAEVGAFEPLAVAGALDHAGQQRARQREVGAERDAAGHADDGEGRHVAGAQQRGPGEGGDGQHHAGQPGARQAEARHRAHPQRHRQRAGGEVAGQEQRLEGRGLQPVADEEQHQRGRHRAGDAVDQVDRPAGGGRPAWRSGERHRRRARRAARAGCRLRRARTAAPRQRQQRRANTTRGHRPARPPTAARWPPARRASARPSRQATMRARCASSPPSRAPQAWCMTLTHAVARGR